MAGACPLTRHGMSHMGGGCWNPKGSRYLCRAFLGPKRVPIQEPTKGYKPKAFDPKPYKPYTLKLQRSFKPEALCAIV